MSTDLPLRKTKCVTCPFRDGSPYAYLAGDLAAKSMTEASRICHQTGANNAINRRTGKPPHLCRGSRDIQLQFMATVGMIAAETDEAWNETRVQLGMAPTVVKDP